MRVKMFHPELDRTMECSPSAVAVHRDAGWVPVEDAPEPELEPGDPALAVVPGEPALEVVDGKAVAIKPKTK